MSQAVLEGIARQWGVANTLTALRALLTLPIILLVFFGHYYTAAALAVFATITDAEGFYARYTKTETELGRVFDPLADKFFTDVLLIALAFITYSPLVLLLAVVTVAYDVDNTMRRIVEILAACTDNERIANDTPVTLISKCKTSVLFAVVIMLLLSLGSASFATFTPALTFFGLLLVLGSWVSNRKDFIRSLF